MKKKKKNFHQRRENSTEISFEKVREKELNKKKNCFILKNLVFEKKKLIHFVFFLIFYLF